MIIQASGASIQRNDRPDAALLTLPSNSKFFNPQLDDETNLQLIDGEYDDETNATQTGKRKNNNNNNWKLQALACAASADFYDLW